MRLTERDVRVVKDLALSHTLSRDQLLALGHFNSLTRVNTRLRQLIRLGLVRRLESPFYSQSLYMATKAAMNVAGERVSPLIVGRASSPRFVQHALQVTEVRLALHRKADGCWRFEQQLWRRLDSGTTVKPDGLFLAKEPIFVEVDMGHASQARIGEKLASYQRLATSGQCGALYGFDEFKLLFLCAGELRSRRLLRVLPREAIFDSSLTTFGAIGAKVVPTWC